MTRRLANYNCHNLIRWRIQDQTHVEIFRELSRPFSFFEVQNTANPDIFLNVAPFEPKEGTGQFWIDHKFLVGMDYLYCQEKSTGGGYQVEIQGWDHTPMTIQFYARLSLSARAIMPLALVHHAILRPALLYQLSRQGAGLLHGAGICRDERAIVLAGTGQSFKTSVAMDFVRMEGYRCLGDDAVIVYNAQVYPFPIYPQLFIYRTLYLENENLPGIPGRIRAINFQRRRDLPMPISKRDFIATSAVPLAAVVVVSRKRSATEAVMEEIDREAAINILVASSYLETATQTFGVAGQMSTAFTQFLDAYALVYPESRAAVFWRNFATTIQRSLDSVPCYELVLPTVYSKDVFNQVRPMINSI